MEHRRGMPDDDKTSTDESSSPPVTIITEMVGGEFQESNLV